MARASSSRGSRSRTAAEPSQASPYGRVVLITGPEGLLADRAVAELAARAQAEQPDVEISQVDGGTLDSSSLAEITGGSLFATRRMAVVRALSDLPADLADQTLQLAIQPDPDIAVVLVHPGGMKGKGLLDKLRKQKSVETIDCPALKPWELPQFVKAEFRRLGARVEDEAAQHLVEAVGQDLRGLAAAARQLYDDADGAAISAELVGKYFGGRSEVTSFAVADAAMAGRTTAAMEQLRWALATGTPPVLITSALASGLRGLGKLHSAAGGMRENDLAREVGVPPWKLKSMRGQLRGWDARGLAHALTVVAQADADIKGAADNADFALEKAVLAVTRSRRS